MNKENIYYEVEKTLQSLHGITRAEANPFLFTRIKARMQKQKGWEIITSFISRPLIAVGVLVLVIAINGWAVFASGNDNTVLENESMAITDVDNEYTLATTTNYEYENNVNE